MELVGMIIIVLILGALFGGETLGETIRKGCGVFAILILIGLGLFYIMFQPGCFDYGSSDSQPQDINERMLFVSQTCSTYTKPDNTSKTLQKLVVGDEVVVRDIDKFNYFYECEDEYGAKYYVLKSCLSSH